MISLSEMTILITDDMEPMCKSIRGMLKVLNFGKSFFFAHNGRDAWKILNENQVDLAILDWNMPIMTGIELVGLIRADKKIAEILHIDPNNEKTISLKQRI